MGDQKKLILNKLGSNQYWSDIYQKNSKFKKFFFFKLLLFQEIFQFLFLNTFFLNLSFRKLYHKKYNIYNRDTVLSFYSFSKKKLEKKKRGIYLSRVNTLYYQGFVLLVLTLYMPQRKKRTRKKFRIFANKLLFKQIISTLYNR